MGPSDNNQVEATSDSAPKSLFCEALLHSLSCGAAAPRPGAAGALGWPFCPPGTGVAKFTVGLFYLPEGRSSVGVGLSPGSGRRVAGTEGWGLWADKKVSWRLGQQSRGEDSTGGPALEAVWLGQIPFPL